MKRNRFFGLIESVLGSVGPRSFLHRSISRGGTLGSKKRDFVRNNKQGKGGGYRKERGEIKGRSRGFPRLGGQDTDGSFGKKERF